jgi:hypothetical protein
VCWGRNEELIGAPLKGRRQMKVRDVAGVERYTNAINSGNAAEGVRPRVYVGSREVSEGECARPFSCSGWRGVEDAFESWIVGADYERSE